MYMYHQTSVEHTHTHTHSHTHSHTRTRTRTCTRTRTRTTTLTLARTRTHLNVLDGSACTHRVGSQGFVLLFERAVRVTNHVDLAQQSIALHSRTVYIDSHKPQPRDIYTRSNEHQSRSTSISQSVALHSRTIFTHIHTVSNLTYRSRTMRRTPFTNHIHNHEPQTRTMRRAAFTNPIHSLEPRSRTT